MSTFYNAPSLSKDVREQIARQAGILGANESAGGGLLAERRAGLSDAQRKAYSDALRAAEGAQAAGMPMAGQGAGATPLFAEPLHEYEKQALMTAGQGTPQDRGMYGMAQGYLTNMAGQQTVNPMAQRYMRDAGQYTARGAAPISFEEVEAARNPYAEALQERLTQQGQRARQQILANQGMRGGQSFGDTSMGVRQGMLDEEMLQRRGEIDYQTYETARDMLEQQRAREMTAGGQFGNLGTAAQGVTQSGFGLGFGVADRFGNLGATFEQSGRTTLQDQLGAGQYIRDYNQNISDQVQQDMLARIGYDPQRLGTAMSLLGQYQSNTSTGPQAAQTSPLSQIGGLATSLSGLGKDEGWWT